MEETDAQLEPEVRVMQLLNARAAEIEMTSEDVKKKYPKLASQQLPFHMRRRSVSHNIKRLPKRLRPNEQAEGTQAKKTKRPSRKYRRRPSNLLDEYTRRKRNNVWLETHIWFAKRFKMDARWGYKIALNPNDKSLRATYRAMAKHCLLLDISYNGCIELKGSQEDLLEGLSQICSPKTGLTFAAISTLSGSREGTLIAYHCHTYPNSAIGPITFNWMPIQTGQSDRRIWIWCHPLIYEEMGAELTSIFKLNESKASKKRKRDPKDIELEPRQFSNTNRNIKMTYLKDTLNRFRLLGPLSQSVLNQVLKMADISEMDGSRWWQNYYNGNREELDLQADIWKRLQGVVSSSELPPRAVLGLTVCDPRIKIPKIKTKATPNLIEMESDPILTLPPSVSNSAIWSADIRQIVKDTKMPQHQLNKLKQETLDSELDLGIEGSRIPILLIQQPAIPSSGYSGGWDIIIPAGWSMSFWIPFIYREARAGGLRDLRNVGFESEQAVFPDCYPDTKSGQEMSQIRRKELMGKHFRYPPDKRPNFEKLGVPVPFISPWLDLTKEWAVNCLINSSHSYFVLRDKKTLSLLSKTMQKLGKKNYEMLPDLDPIRDNAIVLVSLSCLFKGKPSEFSSISLPTDKDFQLTKLTIKPPGPKENRHEVKIKEKAKTKQAANLIATQPEVNDLVGCCDYKIMGFVTEGMFSFTKAQGSGLGFVTLNGLIELIKRCNTNKSQPVVLIRAQNSYQYRYAKLTVIC